MITSNFPNNWVEALFDYSSFLRLCDNRSVQKIGKKKNDCLIILP